ncbi:MAG: TadE/TadG family type IV pilus assembly protein [Brevundimonas sp.]|uniref:TadE/TadG family type IV pilus assembly protein n=1 Tax=Brevundimonas sp. TaxID=1871086 RepID=UPI00391D1D74
MTDRPVLNGLRQGLALIWRSEAGTIAIKFALAFPVLAVVAVGAIDLSEVQSSKTRLQDIADNAALAGAAQLRLATNLSAAVERASAYVDGHLQDWTHAPEVTQRVQVITIDGQNALEVVLDAHRDSFFGSMLPPGGWHFSAEARAVTLARAPLCVLITGDRGERVMNVRDYGRISAPACMIHSNRDIIVDGGSVSAAEVQAVTDARGTITPLPGVDAASVPDPFADSDFTPPHACSGAALPGMVQSGVLRLSPGVHCGDIAIVGDAVLVLEPGEHWFSGGVVDIRGQGRLIGNDVALMFAPNARFEFRGQATVDLEGRRTGPYAGFAVVSAPANIEEFLISADNVRRLLGVIYIPNAQLVVEGRRTVAQDSAWTVIVARQLRLNGSPSLIINAGYGFGNVPVPEGVGPSGGSTQLIE